jgi:hypothetical protein
MFKKLLSIFCVMVIGFIGMLFTTSNQASAATQSFMTHDGKWDNYIITESRRNDVTVKVYKESLYRSWGTGTLPANPNNLSVRLCNTYSLSCTGWKFFSGSGDGFAKFYDMSVGSYYVDIRDHYSDQWVYGKNNTYLP